MEYIVYRRFKSDGIDGAFNIKYGTIITEDGGFLFSTDGRRICAVTSENGWNHFRPNTEHAKRRQSILESLYRFYEKNKGAFFYDVDISKIPTGVNTYWKNILRTMPDFELQNLYFRRRERCTK